MPSIPPARTAGHAKAANVLLWIAQGLLAALFLFAGVAKLTMPLDPIAQMTGFPVAFLQFIALSELLGALGLILPGALGIHRELTPLAAIGLVGVMTGATITTAAMQGIAPALFPLFVGVVLTTVVRGRRSWARGRGAARGVLPPPEETATQAARQAA
jgi:uncharacterized membrane protein YphA (DoxX/SURF4 family)